MLLFLNDCDACGRSEERVWEDSWTGRTVCNMCLGDVINQVTNSPHSEGDNLNELLPVEEGVA